MRALPSGLTAAIESGAASLCTCWLLTRADGTKLGFTDHDRNLALNGVTCAAATGWTAGGGGDRAWCESRHGHHHRRPRQHSDHRGRHRRRPL